MAEQNLNMNKKKYNLPLIITLSSGALFVVIGILILGIMIGLQPNYSQFKNDVDVTRLENQVNGKINEDKYYILEDLDVTLDLKSENQTLLTLDIESVFNDNPSYSELDSYMIQLNFSIYCKDEFAYPLVLNDNLNKTFNLTLNNSYYTQIEFNNDLKTYSIVYDSKNNLEFEIESINLSISNIYFGFYGA